MDITFTECLKTDRYWRCRRRFKWLYRGFLEYFGPGRVVTHHVADMRKQRRTSPLWAAEQEFPALPISSCRGSAIRK